MSGGAVQIPFGDDWHGHLRQALQISQRPFVTDAQGIELTAAETVNGPGHQRFPLIVWPSWLSAYFLRSRGGYPSKPSETEAERHGYRVAEDVFEHVETGIGVWAHALDLRELDFEGDTALLFHYTDQTSFALITDLFGESIRLFASRNANADANFGYGTYASSKPPDSWQSMTEVLINNYWPRTTDWERWCGDQNPPCDPTLGGTMRTFDSARGYIGTHMEEYANRHSGRAAWCLPILCDALDVIDVRNQETPAAYMPPNQNGQHRVRRRGTDRWGDAQPPWRDVHVVTLWGKDPGAETLGVQNLSLAVTRIKEIRALRRRGRDVIARVRAGANVKILHEDIPVGPITVNEGIASFAMLVVLLGKVLIGAKPSLPRYPTWIQWAFSQVDGGVHAWLQEDGRMGLLPGHYRVLGGCVGGVSSSHALKMALFIGDRCIVEGTPSSINPDDTKSFALTSTVFDIMTEASLEIRTLHAAAVVSKIQASGTEIRGRGKIVAFVHLERLE